MQQAILFCCYG